MKMISLKEIKDKLNPQVQKIIVAYPGRFQFYGPHHNDVYRLLQTEYGSENVYIITTNKVEIPKSPFDFYEKREVMAKFGVDRKYICEVKYPYAPVELMNRFTPEKTALFLALGKKDIARFEHKYIKKDGILAHIQSAETASEFNSIAKNSYILEVPHIVKSIYGVGEMSGTTLRQMLKSGNAELFETVMGWYDPSLYNKLYKKLTDSPTEINEVKAPKINLVDLLPIYMR